LPVKKKPYHSVWFLFYLRTFYPNKALAWDA